MICLPTCSCKSESRTLSVEAKHLSAKVSWAGRSALRRTAALAGLCQFLRRNRLSSTGNQNGEIERFWKVVVGPGFKSLENVFRAAASSQHEQRV